MYYIVLSIGLILALSQAILLIFMYQDKELLSFDGFKSLFGFLVGVTLLVITLPSLKTIIQKDMTLLVEIVRSKLVHSDAVHQQLLK